VRAAPRRTTEIILSVPAFIRFAWITLAVTIVVIVWGAVVRATGSGAGCGSHWPLCNGGVVPLAPATATIIEFTHRLTSGVAMILALVLALWARRVFPAGHRARRWAIYSLIFMLVEAAIGAGIVLLELVADDASPLRAGYIAVHLTNTMFLVGAMTATIRFSGARVLGFSGPTGLAAGLARARRWQVIALVLMVVVAAAGAIVALGDTLFPHASLAEGIAADLDPTSHFLIRLRVWHPIAAVIASVLAITAFRRPIVTGCVLFQVGLGVINLMMHAPLPLQMAHLLVSNILWMAMVWYFLDDYELGR
jgi:cytochrome c oxidase assembly protein subunit 15